MLGCYVTDGTALVLSVFKCVTAKIFATNVSKII